MKTRNYIFILVLVSVLYSCQASNYTPSPNGDIAELTLKGNRILKGELLAVSDTMILIVKNKSILGIESRSLNQIFFKKYKDNSWLIGVATMEVLPALMLTLLVASHESDATAAVFAVTMIPVALSTTLFLTSQPKTTYDGIADKSETDELRKFARYPGGITERQLAELLEFYGQDSIIYLK